MLLSCWRLRTQPSSPDSLRSHSATPTSLPVFPLLAFSPHPPSGLRSPPPPLRCAATGSQARGCRPPNIPGALPTLAPFQGQLLCIPLSSVTNIYCTVLSARLCAGRPRGLGERRPELCPACALFPLCNGGGAGCRFPQAPLLPSTAGLPPPSLSPTWHLAPLPCFEVLSGFWVSPARCSDRLPPFTSASERLPGQGPVLSGGSEGRERRVCTTVTRRGRRD